MQHAPVAEAKAAFPLVIFSHGIGGNRLAYSAIICSLVRQVACRHVLLQYAMPCQLDEQPLQIHMQPSLFPPAQIPSTISYIFETHLGACTMHPVVPALHLHYRTMHVSRKRSHATKDNLYQRLPALLPCTLQWCVMSAQPRDSIQLRAACQAANLMHDLDTCWYLQGYVVFSVEHTDGTASAARLAHGGGWLFYQGWGSEEGRMAQTRCATPGCNSHA